MTTTEDKIIIETDLDHKIKDHRVPISLPKSSVEIMLPAILDFQEFFNYHIKGEVPGYVEEYIDILLDKINELEEEGN